jgi:hypothetical protein
MVKEPVDLLMGQSRPTALDEVGLPHREILVVSNESSDKVHTRQVVVEPCVKRIVSQKRKLSTVLVRYR